MRRLQGVLVFVLSAAAAAAPSGPVNLDFRQGSPGQLPPGWSAPVAQAGYPAELSTNCRRPGGRCAVLRARSGSPAAPFGNLMQSFDAASWRGRQVSFRAWVRVEQQGQARAQLWLRVDREGGQMGFFDNMAYRPVMSSEWAQCEIAGRIDDDAARINVGMMITGKGAAYLDGAVFEAAGAVAAPASRPPKALTARGLRNLTAFARLYGWVRYFHPSEAAAAADWDRLAISGVEAVEAAATDARLVSLLSAWLRPVAPLARVYLTSGKPPPARVGTGAKMVSWRHFGLGGTHPQNIYKSERVTAAVPAAGLPAPWVGQLCPGVEAAVPVALYASGASRKSPPPPAIRHNGRSARLADVIIAWNVFEHFYPYFDDVETDWPRSLEEALQGAAACPGERAFRSTLRRLLAAAHDGHADVQADGAPAPIPVAWEWIEDRLVVTAASEAIAHQVEPGDTVLAIGGIPAEKAVAAVSAETSAATPWSKRRRAVEELRVPPPGEALTLDIEPYRQPGRRRQVTLRGGYATLLNEPRPDRVAELKPGVWYADLTRLQDEDWPEAVKRLAAASAVVFDLRGYTMVKPDWIGHLAEQSVTSPQWHVPVVTLPGRTGMRFEQMPGWQLRPASPRFPAKRAVLADARAISYAESCLAIVEHYRLAEIVGEPTAGTNGNVNPITLPGGWRFGFTGMKVLKHDGTRHHGVGVQPTVPVSRTRAGVAAGKDEVLEKALEFLTAKR